MRPTTSGPAGTPHGRSWGAPPQSRSGTRNLRTLEAPDRPLQGDEGSRLPLSRPTFPPPEGLSIYMICLSVRSVSASICLPVCLSNYPSIHLSRKRTYFRPTLLPSSLPPPPPPRLLLPRRHRRRRPRSAAAPPGSPAGPARAGRAGPGPGPSRRGPRCRRRRRRRRESPPAPTHDGARSAAEGIGVEGAGSGWHRVRNALAARRIGVLLQPHSLRPPTPSSHFNYGEMPRKHRPPGAPLFRVRIFLPACMSSSSPIYPPLIEVFLDPAPPPPPDPVSSPPDSQQHPGDCSRPSSTPAANLSHALSYLSPTRHPPHKATRPSRARKAARRP